MRARTVSTPSGVPLIRGRREALGAGLAATLLFAACGEPTPSYTCPPMAEGVDVVANAGPGTWAEEDVSPRLTELWRRGGTREGEELSMPTFPAVSPAGRLAVPDFRLAEVIVIEPDGTWLGSWTRSGGGPGEIRSAVAASWTADGELLVFDVAGSKVLRLTGPSEVAEQIPVIRSFTAPVLQGGELLWAGLLPHGDALLVAHDRPGTTDGPEGRVIASVLRLEAGAESPDTVSRGSFPTVTVNRRRGWAVPGWPRPVAATNTRGELLTGATDGSYRLLVRDSSGRPSLQVCRDADPLPLTDVERGESLPRFVQEQSQTFRESMEGVGQAIQQAEAPPESAPFGRVVLGAGGRIWVQRERPPAFPGSRALVHGEAGGRHDVFAADGAYLGEVRMPEGEALQAALGDTIWTFEVGELNETWVRARELSLEPAGPEDRAEEG